MKVRRIKPMMRRIFVDAMINSLSPYHLTATTFKSVQTTKAMATQAAGLTSDQYPMTVATAEYSTHTSMTPAKKYVQPIAKPSAGSTNREASSKIVPRTGR